MSIFYDFISLIFPRVCTACGKPLFKFENVICTFCEQNLPRTNFHEEKDNPVSRTFWGRVNLENAAAMLYFNKGSKVQTLIHKLKYKGKKEVGIRIGEIYGKDLRESELYKDVDIIIPVPLHLAKQRKRGYNQSEMIAIGLGKSFNKFVDTQTLKRVKHTETQTKKSRIKRWENVKEIFEVKNTDGFKNKHILLVDDVLTTGATIESCVNAFGNDPGFRISVITIAYAKN
jgi:ComF family protein